MAIFVLVVLCVCLFFSIIATFALLSEADSGPVLLSVTMDLILILAIIFQSIIL